MIIKFEVNGSWQLFDDVDSCMYRKIGPHDGLKDEGQEVIDFADTLNKSEGSQEGNPGRVLLTFMNSKQTANSQVVAFSPIYLMNNNGKILEII